MINQELVREINLIVIHCSGTRVDKDVTAKDIDAYHRTLGYSCAGYHYYIRKDGSINTMRPEQRIGAHALGYNKNSIGVCYEGGLDENSRPADTRTLKQQIAMHLLVYNLLLKYPKARVVGHRDLSPDLNHDGIIAPYERVKQCPCFDAIPELEHFRPSPSVKNEPFGLILFDRRNRRY